MNKAWVFNTELRHPGVKSLVYSPSSHRNHGYHGQEAVSQHSCFRQGRQAQLPAGPRNVRSVSEKELTPE